MWELIQKCPVIVSTKINIDLGDELLTGVNAQGAGRRKVIYD